jgi:hypothetical protein
VFCEPLHQVRQLLQQKRFDEAHALSDRLTSLVRTLFAIVAPVSGGNQFTNANKVADHFYAYGPKAAAVPPPRLHSGFGLSTAMVEGAGAALNAHGLMPAKGYLE